MKVSEANGPEASVSDAWSAVNNLTAPGTISYEGINGTSYSSATAPTDAGSYRASVTVGSATATKNFSIAKAASAITNAPTANTLTYTGEAQALITAGTASGGTMQYKLGDGEYSTDIPTATDAGDYTVCYKVVGDVTTTTLTQPAFP